MDSSLILISFIATFATFTILYFLWRRSAVVVNPHETVLRLAWGRCAEKLSEPGFYFRPQLLIAGHRTIRVSRQLDYQIYRDIHVSDIDGTTLRLDVWLESRVEDAHQSVFGVESWQDALRHLVSHVLMTLAGSTKLDDLLKNREQLADSIREQVQEGAKTWGITVESVHIQDVRLLSEISRQLFNRVAAKIEMKKARLEEQGRIAIQTLQAETQLRISELQAKAKTMHPLAVARAYSRLAEVPETLDGYQELHQLSLVQPGKLVSFVGFGPGEVRPLDAMMIPVSEDKSPQMP